jgi:hypothetical protein
MRVDLSKDSVATRGGWFKMGRLLPAFYACEFVGVGVSKCDPITGLAVGGKEPVSGLTADFSAVVRLPGLELPAQDEADAKAGQGGHFWVFANIFAEVRH